MNRLSLALLGILVAPRLQALDPLVYTIRIASPETQIADVELSVPTEGRSTVDMMMPVWTPGYFVQEDFAARVQELSAVTPDGTALRVERTRPNRWQIETKGSPRLLIRYRLVCKEASVSLNWVGSDYALFNGSGTYITLADDARRPHEVKLELPEGWTRSMTGLPTASDRLPHHYRAADYETLTDSPILAGAMLVREFAVDGKKHYLVSAGDVGRWDGDRAVQDVEKMARATGRFWRSFPFEQYTFLIVFRQGGGGLEHRNSTMVTASPTRSGTLEGYRAWLGLVSHEYFHTWNAKRLRPVELGPFDFESPPRVTTLWIPEGLTSYYTGLILRRAGLRTEEETLSSLSAQIERLQETPGRLKQTLEQSSYDVWTNSRSGVNPRPDTVSYYVKGHVLGFLLDARIRRSTGGAKTLDDVMRLAYERYSGERGFIPDEFRMTAEEVAGADLKEWFRRATQSTEELDYEEALEWFGLRFSNSSWKLEIREKRTELQNRQLEDWLRTEEGPEKPAPLY